jgi:hypothetical protein
MKVPDSGVNRNTVLVPIISESLVSEIMEHIADQHSTVNENERLVLALWIIVTYFYEDCDVIPYLHIASDIPDCGKTIIAHIINRLAYKADIVDPTVSALSTFYNSDRRTIIIDEIHQLLMAKTTDKDAFIRLLNHGNRPGVSWEVASKTIIGETDKRQTFFPKVFVGLAPDTVFNDALTSRCIRIIVTPGTELDQNERERRQTIRPVTRTAERLRLSISALGNIPELHERMRKAFTDADIMLWSRTLGAENVLINRNADIWRPIIHIADMVSETYGKQIRAYILETQSLEPAYIPTRIDQIDNAFRRAMRDGRITIASYLNSTKSPLGNKTYSMTNADFGWPRRAIKGKLPGGSLIINADKWKAELRFRANEFDEICASIGLSRKEVIQAYKQATRLHTDNGRSSIKLAMFASDKQTSVIAIDVSPWFWEDAPLGNEISKAVERIFKARTETDMWNADD